jgi:hypothetical protein
MSEAMPSEILNLCGDNGILKPMAWPLVGEHRILSFGLLLS